MSFNEIMESVSNVLTTLGITIKQNDYDGVLVKKLRSSNTLDDNRTTNQTHIALTGKQMDIFPFLCSYGYFENDYSNRSEVLKRYFIVRVPFIINKVNYQYLFDNTTTSNPTPISDFDNDGNKKVYSCVFRSRRNNAADQTQWSLLDKDDISFINFRRIINGNDYIIVLKSKNKFIYSIYAIKEDDAQSLENLNGQFDTLNTTTAVDIDALIDGDDKNEFYVGGQNILFYGVPGTGKSYTIKQTYHPTIDNSERVVFHPDYTYSDFVGQILPETKKDDNGNDIISYPFTPGPFTRILKKASKEENKDKPFYLIIEEINRGNAPAIFGEIFQLLDRCDETDKADDPSVNIGESVYSINNADIAKEVYGDSEHPVKIPANLFILATMNTADQNVFTLDTAFKRRWIMKSIKNNINDCGHANNHICGRNVTWRKFATEINNRILEYGEGNLSSEDNRLGAYFVKVNELNDSSVFAEKVLMYLWNDAFKYDREKVFKNQYKSLEQLIDGFEENAFDIFVDSFEFDNSEINTDEVNNADTDDNDTDNAEISVSDYYEGKNQQMVELCQNLITDLSETIDDMIIGARANYIALRLPGNNRPKNVVEIHIKRDKISLHIKEPSNAEYRIGELLPDNYRWSLNYRIDFVDSDNLNQIVEILQDSFANMR